MWKKVAQKSLKGLGLNKYKSGPFKGLDSIKVSDKAKKVFNTIKNKRLDFKVGPSKKTTIGVGQIGGLSSFKDLDHSYKTYLKSKGIKQQYYPTVGIKVTKEF